MARPTWTSALDFKCFNAPECTKNLCTNKLETHPVSNRQADRLTDLLKLALFIGFSSNLNPSIYTLVLFSSCHARCGTVAGIRKPNPNGPRAWPHSLSRRWSLQELAAVWWLPRRKAVWSRVHRRGPHSHIGDWQSSRQQTEAHNTQREVHRTWERPDVCY